METDRARARDVAFKVARAAVGRVHSTVQRSALRHLMSILENQQRELAELEARLAKAERILEGG